MNPLRWRGATIHSEKPRVLTVHPSKLLYLVNKRERARGSKNTKDFFFFCRYIQYGIQHSRVVIVICISMVTKQNFFIPPDPHEKTLNLQDPPKLFVYTKLHIIPKIASPHKTKIFMDRDVVQYYYNSSNGSLIPM
jgi:hypothetical protein